MEEEMINNDNNKTICLPAFLRGEVLNRVNLEVSDSTMDWDRRNVEFSIVFVDTNGVEIDAKILPNNGVLPCLHHIRINIEEHLKKVERRT